ncbi:MAG: phosphatidate cytidylyltransferase [Clostridiales bacterium]|nr:phosphatidate cytidylyltransferase [Clostridiales bacterium]
MKKKVIAGILCAIAGIGALWLSATFPFVLPIATLVLTLMTVYEVNHAMGIRNIALWIVSMLAGSSFSVHAFLLEYVKAYKDLSWHPGFLFCIYGLVVYIIMLTDYEHIKFGDASSVFVLSIAIPFAITRYIYLFNLYPDEKSHGVFLILFVMFCAWLTDAWAYFGGSFFGKHKLAPKISPKKTVEGAVAGVIGGILSAVILYAVFENFFFAQPEHKYLQVALVSLVVCVFSMFGDLTFSVIKRNCGIKDFSNLVPGHGGVMDRFDSEVFAIIAFYAIINIFNGVMF